MTRADALHVSPEVAEAAQSTRSEADARLALALRRFLAVLDVERAAMVREINASPSLDQSLKVITASMGVIYTARDRLAEECGL